MVKKLMKYDFQSFFRLIFPAQVILIGIAGLNRIIQLFETKDDSVVYSGVFSSSIVLYVISIIALVLLTLIVAMVRFYQGMYSSEGYLSHTLPVTPRQHILSKMLTGFLFELGTLFAVFISLNVITLGDVNIEVYKALGYLTNVLFTECGGHGALYILEAIILAFISEFCMLLMLYMCISIGQLAKKKKILLAVGVLFGIYVLFQILSTTLIIVVYSLPETVVEEIAKWIRTNGIAFTHIALCGGIILYSILALIFFFVNKRIMTRKLNLT